MIKEFNINFTKKEISLIYQKVKDYPWDSISNLNKWDHGTNKKYLKELCKYWVSDFDWKKQQTKLINQIMYAINIHLCRKIKMIKF